MFFSYEKKVLFELDSLTVLHAYCELNEPLLLTLPMSIVKVLPRRWDLTGFLLGDDDRGPHTVCMSNKEVLLSRVPLGLPGELKSMF